MSSSASNGSHSFPGVGLDPVALARRDLQKALRKRFYREAAVAGCDGAFVVALDGRPALTPARVRLALPTRPAAEAVAAEWAVQGEQVDPTRMPMTRIVNAALDGVGREAEAVRTDIVRYAASDLLCYRAAEPEALAAAERATWDPVLAWAEESLGVKLKLATGVVHVAQPEAALAAAAEAVRAVAVPLPLACLHVMTTLTGSALLALALAHRRLTVAEAWAAAHVDEDFEIAAWGEDAPAMARRAAREADMRAAACLFDLLHSD